MFPGYPDTSSELLVQIFGCTRQILVNCSESSQSWSGRSDDNVFPFPFYQCRISSHKVTQPISRMKCQQAAAFPKSESNPIRNSPKPSIMCVHPVQNAMANAMRYRMIFSHGCLGWEPAFWVSCWQNSQLDPECPVQYVCPAILLLRLLSSWFARRLGHSS